MPAYLLEYYKIYDKIIKLNFIEKEYKIISIGCGCYIDLWGAYFAQSKHSLDKIGIMYDGLDAVDWHYKDDLSMTVKFYNCDIKNVERFKEEYNIIIFPKSISEMDNNSYDKLKLIFSNTKFEQNRIILASTVRINNKYTDLIKIKELITVLNKVHKFRVLDEVNEYSIPKKINGKDCNLSDMINELNYPEKVISYINSLDKSFCKFNRNNNCNVDMCKGVFERSPITTTSQIMYTIVRLEREEN